MGMAWRRPRGRRMQLVLALAVAVALLLMCMTSAAVAGEASVAEPGGGEVAALAKPSGGGGGGGSGFGAVMEQASGGSGGEVTNSPEEPTCANGWRELGPDEAVVPGSHVQLNLSTGKKHVKEPCTDGVAELGGQQDAEHERVAMMERVLYGLPEPDPRLPSAGARAKMTPEQYEAALDMVWKFRQAEVTKAMESMEDEGTQVLERTKTLFAAVGASTDGSAPAGGEAELREALEFLEPQVQDIDLALHFVNIGGLDACAQLMARHEGEGVRPLAAHVAGNAVKNHPKMQQQAVDAGVLSAALARLEQLAPCAAAGAGDECSKMLYAVGSVTRGFVPAQREAVAAGVLPLGASLLDKDSGVGERPLQKALALVADSLLEWHVPVSDWAHNTTGLPLCDALSHRANLLRIGPHGQPGAPAAPPQTKAVAQKLRQAILAAGCDTTVVDSSALFL